MLSGDTKNQTAQNELTTMQPRGSAKTVNTKSRTPRSPFQKCAIMCSEALRV